MATTKFSLLDLSNVEVNTSQDLCEIPFIKGIFEQLKEEPFFPNYHYLITDHLTDFPDERIDSQTIIFYLSNEDGHLPSYIERSGILFTPYPPKKANPKAFTIPLGYHGKIPALNPLPMEERSLDLFFSGRKIHRRKAFFDRVDQVQQNDGFNIDIRRTNAFSAGLKPLDYATMLNQTKIAPAPEGNYSNITFRLFESMRQGSIPIVPTLPETWFFKHFTGYQVSDWASLPSLLSGLMANKAKLSQLQKDIIDYYNHYCSEQAAARYISQVLQHYSSL